MIVRSEIRSYDSDNVALYSIANTDCWAFEHNDDAVRFILQKGELSQGNAALTLNWEGDWNREGYLLMP